MLVIAGLGIYGLRDLTLGTLEYLKRADAVYVESYTSLIPDFNVRDLEGLVGRNAVVIGRNVIEGEKLYEIIEMAREKLVVLLAPGDPFIATTHIVIKLEAIKRGVEVQYLPAPSVVNAISAATGLDFYKFCQPVTIVSPRPSYFPLTPYYVLMENLKRGLHTLFLLELDVERGYAMRAEEAAQLLRSMEERVGKGIIDCEETLFVSVARASSPSQIVKAFKLTSTPGFGPPPHVLIVPGLLNPVEKEALQLIAGASPLDVEKWHSRVKAFMKEKTSYCVQ
ncbi:MAG: diphthine synthase [Thermofilaceae archaeon]